MTLELTLSCDNSDLNRALLNGEVEPDGIDLMTTVTYPPKRHRDFFRNQHVDICEVGLASYLSSRDSPEEYPFTAIPVFPSKQFRHAFFYTHADADFDDVSDLNGARIGVQSWQTAANVWTRGILGEQYGLDLDSVEWYRRREDDVPVELPERFEIQPVPGVQDGDAIEEPKDMQRMLADGELDAAMDPSETLLRAAAESEEIEFVFDEPRKEERAYFEDTGIHPPMHVIAIRDELLDTHPWVARSVYDAFCDARDRALEWNERPLYHMSIVWAHLYLIDERELFGEDLWEYGLTEKTRRELETFSRYAAEQGLVEQSYDPGDLFVDIDTERAGHD
ncbi:ABC transporter substrate-binding protein [Natranaeroarchaeum sulfidigenes]|uniref:ABC-type nitrate/sulfonate/bicarbonate transportsystem, periplasmic component n=1 Tax=Natranaeroarchaeum sulfidigenes TaxID=2784880 RepID=A0A897MN82_9EURY|nr:ABC transporter substrate-binding protein [Natranaeroarchaeum sulfidigenes]QSG01862.1 ABC-type nitrate/sulfonate/bicarbonate transportsystem, periplasmic component [Natranaeroarchaeum sulfidigenes]